jgi:hypothetical protein
LFKPVHTLGREALKTGLNIAGDVVQGRNIKQAAEARLKSTGQNLFQKAMDTVGPPRAEVNPFCSQYPCSTLVCVGGTSNKSSSDFVHSHELGCTPPPTSLYPYRAYIETLLSYGPAAKESQLTEVMWFKDTPGHQYKRTIAGHFQSFDVTHSYGRT